MERRRVHVLSVRRTSRTKDVYFTETTRSGSRNPIDQLASQVSQGVLTSGHRGEAILCVRWNRNVAIKKACLSAPSKLGDSVSIQGSLLGFLLQYAFHALRYHVPVLRSTHVRWRCAFLCGLQTEPVKAFRQKTWWPRLHDARIPFSRPLELAFSNPAAFRKRSER